YCLSFSIVFASLVASSLPAAEPLQSGLQVGERLTNIFEPLNVTGPYAGEQHCLVCEMGLSPVAMVFAREVNEPLVKLLAQLDKATEKNRDVELGSFVVFLSEKEGLKEQLENVAKKQGLNHIILSTYDPAGPEGFKVAKDSDVTVVLYRQHLVKANHAIRKGELNEQAVEKIVGDLPKIVGEK
ncbi:MAG TPA: hypothetical protein VFV87_19580, partial [Pirellulaceae bacterium]|nr:hypothetical protein [Pirellulaceae bacterium]